MDRLNQVLIELVKQKGKQVEVAKALGISSQRLGNYLRGRQISVDIITRWRRAYNEDLMVLAETPGTTIVSRETKQDAAMEVIRGLEKNNLNPRHKDIDYGPYIVVYKKAYDELEETIVQNRSVIDMLSRASFELSQSNKKLADSVEEAIKLAKSRDKKQR